MKKRLSFVSNSSSSSFIVSEEDNKYDICFSDYQVMDLKKYFKRFFEREVFDMYFRPSLDYKDFEFVEDAEFNRRFEFSIINTLPVSCKKLLRDYIDMYKTKPIGYKWDSKEMKDFYDKFDVIEDQIIKKCIKSLELKWKDVKFHYSEIEDTWIDEKDEGMETFITDKLDYINSLKPIKFRRYYCNH